MIDWTKINKIYFIGIGGIGISALAGLLKAGGKEVSGSDAQAGELVKKLKAGGVEIKVPHAADNITSDIDLAVYSVAIPEDNPERLKIKELQITELSYPQLLGELLNGKFGIGVSGTDGKTTTTAMLAKILIDAGKDPTVVLGSQAEFLEGNWRLGDGQYFVFEADEYRGAFYNYNPKIAVITNIEIDHLDYYRNGEEYLLAFKNYLKNIPSDGLVIINNDEPRSIVAAKNCPAQKITYGINNPADYVAQNIQAGGGRQEFSVLENGELAAAVTLGLPGHYNISNALAAIAAARQLKVEWKIIIESLAGFKGVWRRFENLGSCDLAEIIADYAHTPPAIKLVIQAAKDFFPNKKILFVFQPHQYSRTKKLFKEFSEAFDGAQQVVIADIFYVKGRERPEDFDVSSEKLAKAVKVRGVDVIYGGDLIETEKKVRELAGEFDVVLVLGAGDVYELAKNLVK